jgi:hypothetical protein
MHGLAALFLEVIVLAIILLLIGLVVLVVPVFATRVIVASIVLMTIVRSVVIAIALVALMVVVVLATMLPVAQSLAVHDRKMSQLLLFWLPLFLGNLLKNAGCFIGSLTLLEKGNKPKWDRGHHLVCLHKLELMCLGLHEEDLFALLLCCGQLHCSIDVTTIKVAEEIYSTPHEVMHWHEGGLLGGVKPTNQLVANIWEPGNWLEVIPDALVEVGLRMVCFSGELLGNNLGLFCETYILETLTHQVEQCWTVVLLCIQKLSQNL